MKQHADYLTAREAAAIRGMPFGGWYKDACNMTIVFQDARGTFAVPIHLVQRYNEDWKASGLWSLPGTKQEFPDVQVWLDGVAKLPPDYLSMLGSPGIEGSMITWRQGGIHAEPITSKELYRPEDPSNKSSNK